MTSLTPSMIMLLLCKYQVYHMQSAVYSGFYYYKQLVISRARRWSLDVPTQRDIKYDCDIACCIIYNIIMDLHVEVDCVLIDYNDNILYTCYCE